jgi:hypothetical protein
MEMMNGYKKFSDPKAGENRMNHLTGAPAHA